MHGKRICHRSSGTLQPFSLNETSCGGAVYSAGGSSTLRESTFASNLGGSTDACGGGDVYHTGVAGASLPANASTNGATEGLVVEDCSFDGSVAYGCGGALSVSYAGSATVSSTLIVGPSREACTFSIVVISD